MDMNKIDFDAIDRATRQYFTTGHTDEKCPRCGNDMTIEEVENSYTVRCQSDNCICETFRGI